jgi:hypothetical protein
VASNSAEIASLHRAVRALADGVAADLKAKPPLNEAERRVLKREIETSMQALDELRTKIAG